MAEVAPVDLRLLSGQGVQAQIGFGFWARPVAGDDMPEIAGASIVAAFTDSFLSGAGHPPGFWPTWPWAPGAQLAAWYQKYQSAFDRLGGGPWRGRPAWARTLATVS
jgi:hypothetical protein